MNRQRFFRSALLSAVGLAISWSATQSGAPDKDQVICQRTFKLAVDRDLGKRPIGAVMVAIASSFRGTPYVANTLEMPGEEHLVINLRGLDCVSLVENTLALSRCVKLGATSFDDYQAQLRLIRYRNGIIHQYPSRLHYFSDWIYNNEQKQILINITSQIGGVPYTKTIDFMTHHVSSYRQLSNPRFVSALRATEETISQRDMFYIPKEGISPVDSLIRDGDIIGITTSIDGLDISHTAIAVWDEGVLKILHAPNVGKSVELSRTSLAEYLSEHAKQTGIMVARPRDPAPPETNQD